MTLVFARPEVSDLVPHLDGNLDGIVTEQEVKDSRAEMDAALVQGTRVEAGGRACAGALDGARLVEGDGLEMTLAFRCPAAAAKEVSVTLDFLDRLTRGHRHLITMPEAAEGSAPAAPFAYREQKTFTVPAGAGAPTSVGVHEWIRLARNGAASAVPALLVLGAVLAVGGTRRDLLAAGGAFTGSLFVAAVAGSHGLAPVARLVPAGVALAILYVGVESFLAEDARGRWLAAIPAGTTLGFALTPAVRELAIPFHERPLAGTPFAAGVALAVTAAGMAGAFAIPALARRAFWPRFVTPLVAAATLAAGAWSLVRAM